MATNSTIEAAGAVLWHEVSGRVLVGIVHRPRYDDWSLPKGKALDGESLIHTAVREVGEETGARVGVSRWLGKVRYQVRDRDGDGPRDKVVRFWAMRTDPGDLVANDEVDEIAWLEPAPARDRLQYAGDRAMLDRLLARALPTSELILIRHANAGRRAEWAGPDKSRPLSRLGRAQARGIADLVSVFAPPRVLAAEPVRCVQTVAPLASRIGVSVEVDNDFADTTTAADARVPAIALAELAAKGEVVAICSQGETITSLISSLDARIANHRPTTGKGAAWVLGCREGKVVSADYYGAARYRRGIRQS